MAARYLLPLVVLLLAFGSAVVGSNSFVIIFKSVKSGTIRLKCYSKIVGSLQVLWDGIYVSEDGEPLGGYFEPTEEIFVVDCSYEKQGSYGAGLRVFDSRVEEDEECRTRKGGCKYVFEGGMVYKETKKRGRRVVGELPEMRCKNKFLFFYFGCEKKPHRGQLAARPITWWQYEIQHPERED